MKKILVLIICVLLGVPTASAGVKRPKINKIKTPSKVKIERIKIEREAPKTAPKRVPPTTSRPPVITGTKHLENPVTGSHPRLGSSRTPSARSTTTQPVQSRVTSSVAPRTSYAPSNFKLEPLPNETPVHVQRAPSRMPAMAIPETDVNLVLSAVRGYTERTHGEAKIKLMNNSRLFELFKQISDSDKLPILEFLRKADQDGVDALLYWHTKIKGKVTDLRATFFTEGLTNPLVRARLDDNVAIFEQFQKATEADKASMLKYIASASEAEVNALAHWCDIADSAVSKEVDFATLQFLTNDPIGQTLLTELRKQDRISEEGYQEITSYQTNQTGKFLSEQTITPVEYINTWLTAHRQGASALRAAQDFLANSSHDTEFFMQSTPGKEFLSGRAFATDSPEGRLPSANEMTSVFARHLERTEGIDPWYFSTKMKPGFPRYHIMDSGNRYLKVYTEREIHSQLSPIKMNVHTVDAWSIALWEEAFSTSSGRVEEVVALMQEFGIKATDIADVSLRAGWHELGGHIHTNFILRDGRLFNYVQDIDFSNSVSAVKNNLGEMNEALGSNIFNGAGKSLYEGKREFLEAIKAQL